MLPDKPEKEDRGNGKIARVDKGANGLAAVVEQAPQQAMVEQTPQQPAQGGFNPNPGAVLHQLGFLQQMRTLGEWADIQDDVWAGHSPLPPDWIRIWSRTRGTEYYLNVDTMQARSDIPGF